MQVAWFGLCSVVGDDVGVDLGARWKGKVVSFVG
jgi:hypothetical protein